MYNFLGIIVGRSGSKGLKNKNIKNFNGKPLIYWSIKSAKNSKLLSKIIINSDSNKIISIAKKNKVEVPFKRPKNLAKDNTLIYHVLRHTIEYYKKKNIYFKNIVLIEPTSPIRLNGEIDKILKYVIKYKIKSLVTVGKTDNQHPNFLLKLSKNNNLRPISKFSLISKRRQDLSDNFFFPNGNLYVSDTETYLKKKTFYHNLTKGWLLRKYQNIEIDDLEDFIITEELHKKFSINE